MYIMEEVIYYVLSHSHWGLGQFFGGGGLVKKRQSPDFRSQEVGISGKMMSKVQAIVRKRDRNQEALGTRLCWLSSFGRAGKYNNVWLFVKKRRISARPIKVEQTKS